MNDKDTSTFPELPPGYCWGFDGPDIDIVKLDTLPPEYPDIDERDRRQLVAWLSSHLWVKERSVTKGNTTFSQKVNSAEEGLALLATRLWLGMNEP